MVELIILMSLKREQIKNHYIIKMAVSTHCVQLVVLRFNLSGGKIIIREIELEDIAKIGGYNVAYTSQFFKKQMGISFVEYVLRLRLREATLCLINTDEAVARIASDCGFADVKAFNVAFKKHFHITPTEYRKQVKNIGRKTTLQDWKEIISVENQDVLNLLHSFLSYEDDSRAKDELEFMSKKLEYLKEKLADVVKGL